MDLILWRHADAEDGFPDEARQLTVKGEKQAENIARWLKPRLPEKVRVLASPARRAQQTVEKLTKSFETLKELAPGVSPAVLLGATGWPDAGGTVIVVGHQPTLGRVAAFLLSGVEAEWSLKKGGIWWLSNRVRLDEPQTVLRVVMPPEFV
jgi:phosphohistidine phosphatase